MRWPLALIVALLCATASAQDADPRALLLDYATGLPPHGASGEWRFMDGQGLADESGNGYTLTLNGEATVSGGVINCAASPLSYATVNAPTNALDYNYSDSFSVACWARPTAHNSNADMLVARMALPDYTGWSLSFIQLGSHDRGIRAQVRLNSSHNISTDSHTGLPTNEWLHVAMTYAGNSAAPIVYVNGQTSAIRTTKASLYTYSSLTPVPVRIGCRDEGNFAMTGQIGGVCIWPRVVAQTEIEQEFMKGPPNE